MPTDTPFKERPGRLPTAREIIDGKSNELTRLALGEDLTMPNPVAEVVERLREAADNIERARMSGIVENLAGWEQRAVREAAECIAHLNAERLSRESDTGVPEGFWLAPIRPTDEIMTAAAEAHFGKRRTAQSGGIDGIGMTVDGRDLSFRDAFKSFWKGARSAAPQPPTVSTQGWQDISTAPRDGRWFLICREDEGPESYEVGCFDPQTWSAYEPAENGLYRKVERVVNEWRGFNNFHRATHWTALLGHPGDPDLSTLTRERDQAREALAELQTDLSGVVDNHLDKTEGWIGRELRAKDLPTWWHKVNDVLEKSRARSVLHPDTEVSS